MSLDQTDPTTLFGGTWERIQGRFLLAASSAYAVGSTGGEVTHKLTVAEMPSHSHYSTYYAPKGASSSTGVNVIHNEGSRIVTSSTGGNAAHNNMPPYLTVYMWKRTA